MDAEWIVFATSHGKSPCDGVGGFVKRYVAKSSLQKPLHDQILTWRITFQSQKPCLEQGVATILYQYLATKLLTNS